MFGLSEIVKTFFNLIGMGENTTDSHDSSQHDDYSTSHVDDSHVSADTSLADHHDSNNVEHHNNSQYDAQHHFNHDHSHDVAFSGYYCRYGCYHYRDGTVIHNYPKCKGDCIC